MVIKINKILKVFRIIFHFVSLGYFDLRQFFLSFSFLLGIACHKSLAIVFFQLLETPKREKSRIKKKIDRVKQM